MLQAEKAEVLWDEGWRPAGDAQRYLPWKRGFTGDEREGTASTQHSLASCSAEFLAIRNQPVLVSAGIRQDSTQKGSKLTYKLFLQNTVPGENYI